MTTGAGNGPVVSDGGMTPMQALEILSSAASMAHMTYQDHKRALAACEVLHRLVTDGGNASSKHDPSVN